MNHDISFATLSDKAQIKEIWKQCFGDCDEYIDFFLKNGFDCENALVVRDSGVAVSVLHILPLDLIIGSDLISAGYIYAAATLPEYQGMGLMKKLLISAEEIAKERGIKVLILVPASESLFLYYETAGYNSSIDVFAYDNKRDKKINNNVTIEDCDFEDFYILRSKSFKKEDIFFRWNEKMLRYIYSELLFTGKIIKKFKYKKNIGYVVFYPRNNVLEVKEFAGDKKSLKSVAQQLMTIYNCDRVSARLPVSFMKIKEQRNQFAMVKAIEGFDCDIIKSLNKGKGYFNLALD